MTVSLNRPNAGDVGWAAAINQNWTEIETAVNAGTGYPKGYLEGLRLSYSSATALVVGSGSCRDKDDSESLTLAAESTVSVTSVGALGLDTKTLTATVSTTSSTANATASSSILSEVGTRSLTGTISSSGTAVTGSGTKFLSEVAVGDLVGTDSTYGFSRVTAISSDTALTLVAALPGGNAPSSTAAKAIENATLRFELTTPVNKRVNTLSAAGTAIVADSNFAATESGKTLKVSAEVASCWFAVWIAKGANGTTALLSTQRTSAYLPSGYDSKSRRIGWVRNHADNLLPFAQTGADRTRTYQLENAAYNAVVSAGGSTSWTPATCEAYAPPTAQRLYLMAGTDGGAGGYDLLLRRRSTGDSGTARTLLIRFSGTPSFPYTLMYTACDGAQGFDYVCSISNSATHIHVAAFEEEP